MRQKLSVLIFLMVNVCIAQMGIGIENPEANLDINVKTKLSGLPNVSNQLDQYNHILFLDNQGNVGTKEKGYNNFIYRTSYFSKMAQRVIVQPLVRTNLGMDITVEIPPFTSSLIELNYSIPIINGKTGNMFVLLSKQINANSEVFLYEANRAFSPPRKYLGTGTAKGRAVANVYYDEVQNTTNTKLTVTYRVYGETQDSAAQYGMFGAVANFNWGKGSMNINVFDY